MYWEWVEQMSLTGEMRVDFFKSRKTGTMRVCVMMCVCASLCRRLKSVQRLIKQHLLSHRPVGTLAINSTGQFQHKKCPIIYPHFSLTVLSALEWSNCHSFRRKHASFLFNLGLLNHALQKSTLHYLLATINVALPQNADSKWHLHERDIHVHFLVIMAATISSNSFISVSSN